MINLVTPLLIKLVALAKEALVKEVLVKEILILEIFLVLSLVVAEVHKEIQTDQNWENKIIDLPSLKSTSENNDLPCMR